MKNKKNLIIEAFEQLDANMLDVLLNDDQPYQDVPKDMFVDELKRYFSEMKTSNYSKFDYKAYKGVCQNCSKGKTGYSFINSEGHSFMSLVFEESENDYTDIYNCGSFCTEGKEIEEEMTGISFYKDDEVNYIPTAENILEEKRCNSAFAELQREITTEGILSKQFYNPWTEKYGDIDDISRVFTGEIYRYHLKIKYEISTLKFISRILPLENLAKSYWQEFMAFPIVNRELIQDWLIKCDKDLEYLKYGFGDKANFLAGYFEDRNLKIDLQEFYFYHNVAAILSKYFDWIPETDLPIETFESEGDFEFPF
ncbi:hypothetical protein [Kaistella jeonii]|uniref:Uncharacterized protein n=1 Tax=Kaistella jeonii TaxID=266749 RepID=A0A0C1CYT8_9FLAO|nr:hypothetical protein [Kaistella jeonii]KIA89591.1 hypothetical protein OA86_02865 [Kaistella jeonii]SFB90343.1 hypothetical protein SAMN05421876_103327 [Kaistella jeonii]VEI95800.1 Uncharacterised protein [Kaistella jeonii]